MNTSKRLMCISVVALVILAAGVWIGTLCNAGHELRGHQEPCFHG